jgi:broad specificity phosphatase PhoE
MRLVLVRHGETEINRQGLALGRADVPLNERGRWQAQRVAQALRHEVIASIYASPLQRALDTARAIAGLHGLPVQVNQGLIEMDIGEAEGLAFTEVRSRYPDLMERWASSDGPHTAMPGGERLVDVQKRAWQAIQHLRRGHEGETVVAVTHNFVILCLLTKALRMELAHFRRLRQAIAAISVLELEEENTLVLRFNDTCHLAEES